MPSRASGFSLIELMVVVGIIGVIAAIAYPSYTKSVQKSNRTDAKIALTEAATRQERIYSQSGAYAGNDDIAKLVSMLIKEDFNLYNLKIKELDVDVNLSGFYSSVDDLDTLKTLMRQAFIKKLFTAEVFKKVSLSNFSSLEDDVMNLFIECLKKLNLIDQSVR